MNKKIKKETYNIETEFNNDSNKIKKLQIALKDIKYKFSEAESIAQFGFWEVDPRTLDPTWSDGIFKIVGYDPEYGQIKYYDQKKIIHPEDWDYFYNSLQYVLNTGKDKEIEIRIKKPDDSERIVHLIAKPKNNKNGKVIGVRGTAQDITERKMIEKKLADSERRYRYIVEKAAAGIFILDKNGIIKYLNDHMAYTLNYSKDEMLEKHIKNFVDEEEDFNKPRKPVDIQIKRYNWFKLIDKNKNVFWSNLTVSPIFNSKKEYNGCLGIVTDINIQKGLEEAFLEREEIFTDIIYDMIKMLNDIKNDENPFPTNKKELSSRKLDNKLN